MINGSLWVRGGSILYRMTGHHGAFYRAVAEPDSPLGHTCGSVKNDFVRTNQSSQWPLGTIRVVEAREEGRDGGLGPWSECCNIWYWLRLSKHKEKKHLGLKVRVGAGEMAQYLWARTALPAPSPVPSTHSGWLSTACSSSFRGSHAHFWPSLIPTHMCTDTQVTYPKNHIVYWSIRGSYRDQGEGSARAMQWQADNEQIPS